MIETDRAAGDKGSYVRDRPNADVQLRYCRIQCFNIQAWKPRFAHGRRKSSALTHRSPVKFHLETALHVEGQRCGETLFSEPAHRSMGCPSKAATSDTSGRRLVSMHQNNHSAIAAPKIGAGIGRRDRNWRRFVRRMVGLFRGNQPGNQAFPQGSGPRRKGSQNEWRTGRDCPWSAEKGSKIRLSESCACTSLYHSYAQDQPPEPCNTGALQK